MRLKATWLTRSILQPIYQNPVLRKWGYSIGLRRPALPHKVGMSLYQRKSAWQLQRESCPCDIEFAEYLQTNIAGKSVFHFGTGDHHWIGLENQKRDRPNDVLAITASAPEHQVYVQLVLKDAALAKHYKVLFADIYTLTASLLPTFDVVSLFHLCEFYLPENAPLIHQNDETLLQLFVDKLNPNGKILFYSGSYNWQDARSIVKTFEQSGKLKQVEQYKSLLIYEKGNDRNL